MVIAVKLTEAQIQAIENAAYNLQIASRKIGSEIDLIHARSVIISVIQEYSDLNAGSAIARAINELQNGTLDSRINHLKGMPEG